jgi:pyruvate dehydrogenase E1 component beta subunit
MMQPPERVVANLNRALHTLLERDERVLLLGEDIADPYGGAFKVSKGLSTRFPDRVLSTPISEGAIIGLAGGLALSGDRPIVEMMFGDFIGLGFDQIYNFAAKSVSMYGHRVPMHMLVRCPVGGGRGYGPTHSQSPQKHFLGIPHLSLWELSPLHDNEAVLSGILERGEPGILFEDKVLYGQRMYTGGRISDLFSFDFLDERAGYARVFVGDPEHFDCVVIAPGGMLDRVLTAARDLLVEEELVCQVIVPSRLYPFDVEPLLPTLERAGLVCVVEEGVAGGTWGTEVAGRLYRRMWGGLKRPVALVNSADAIIPTAPHLERDVLVQSDTVYRAISEAFGV